MAPDLTSADQVINAIGGTSAVAALTGRSPQAVNNWKHRDRRFPADTFLIITRALAAEGKSAPADLWGMIGSEERAA